MARPPLYNTSMTRIVKFRVTEHELRLLNDMKSADESMSELLRALIREAAERRD